MLIEKFSVQKKFTACKVYAEKNKSQGKDGFCSKICGTEIALLRRHLDTSSYVEYNDTVIIFFVFNTLITQKGDTLEFFSADSLVETWILGEQTETSDSVEIVAVRKAKVAPDSRVFFIYETKYSASGGPQTKISFYDADRQVLREELSSETRMPSFELSNLYDSLLIFGETDLGGRFPALFIVENGKKDTLIPTGKWEIIVNYELSENCNYLVAYTRNRRSGKLWDYVYSYDLHQKTDWAYLFPLCLTCKRGKLDVSVDDSGKVEVGYKGEYRVFSKSGSLLDIYFK